MAFDINDIDKVYHKSGIDGKHHELGKAIDLGISGVLDCTDTRMDEFQVTRDTFKKTNRGFKPGDLVEIKSWDEMEKEFGLTEYGHINCRNKFIKEMRPFCGKVLTISEICNDLFGSYNVRFVEGSPGGWNYSTDMLKHVDHSYVVDNSISKINVEETTCALDISNLYPEIMIGDDIDYKKYCQADLEITKEGCDAFKVLVQGILEDKKDKKKEEDNMELIKIYKENAMKVITEAIEKETETRMEMDSFVSSYNKLIANFEKDLTKLYEKQPLTCRRLEQSCSSNLYGIRISPLYKDNVATDVAKVYENYVIELDARLAEVEAQLDIIRKANPTNSYELTMNVLRNYGIVDENNMLNKYELPVVESKVEVVEENATEPEKRGRKPKNK